MARKRLESPSGDRTSAGPGYSVLKRPSSSIMRLGMPPLRCPGNDEAEDLACICWLEEAHAEETAAWLHQKMKHVCLPMGWPW